MRYEIRLYVPIRDARRVINKIFAEFRENFGACHAEVVALEFARTPNVVVKLTGASEPEHILYEHTFERRISRKRTYPAPRHVELVLLEVLQAELTLLALENG